MKLYLIILLVLQLIPTNISLAYVAEQTQSGSSQLNSFMQLSNVQLLKNYNVEEIDFNVLNEQINAFEDFFEFSKSQITSLQDFETVVISMIAELEEFVVQFEPTFQSEDFVVNKISEEERDKLENALMLLNHFIQFISINGEVDVSRESLNFSLLDLKNVFILDIAERIEGRLLLENEMVDKRFHDLKVLYENTGIEKIDAHFFSRKNWPLDYLNKSGVVVYLYDNDELVGIDVHFENGPILRMNNQVVYIRNDINGKDELLPPSEKGFKDSIIALTEQFDFPDGYTLQEYNSDDSHEYYLRALFSLPMVQKVIFKSEHPNFDLGGALMHYWSYQAMMAAGAIGENQVKVKINGQANELLEKNMTNKLKRLVSETFNQIMDSELPDSLGLDVSELHGFLKNYIRLFGPPIINVEVNAVSNEDVVVFHTSFFSSKEKKFYIDIELNKWSTAESVDRNILLKQMIYSLVLHGQNQRYPFLSATLLDISTQYSYWDLNQTRPRIKVTSQLIRNLLEGIKKHYKSEPNQSRRIIFRKVEKKTPEELSNSLRLGIDTMLQELYIRFSEMNSTEQAQLMKLHQRWQTKNFQGQNLKNNLNMGQELQAEISALKKLFLERIRQVIETEMLRQKLEFERKRREERIKKYQYLFSEINQSKVIVGGIEVRYKNIETFLDQLETLVPQMRLKVGELRAERVNIKNSMRQLIKLYDELIDTSDEILQNQLASRIQRMLNIQKQKVQNVSASLSVFEVIFREFNSRRASGQTPSKEDYYDVLGVSKNDDLITIKGAFRKLAMQYHPDRNPGDASAEDKMKKILEAWEVLKDQRLRGLYDRHGHNYKRYTSGFLFKNFSKNLMSTRLDIIEGRINYNDYTNKFLGLTLESYQNLFGDNIDSKRVNEIFTEKEAFIQELLVVRENWKSENVKIYPTLGMDRVADVRKNEAGIFVIFVDIRAPKFLIELALVDEFTHIELELEDAFRQELQSIKNQRNELELILRKHELDVSSVLNLLLSLPYKMDTADLLRFLINLPLEDNSGEIIEWLANFGEIYGEDNSIKEQAIKVIVFRAA